MKVSRLLAVIATLLIVSGCAPKHPKDSPTAEGQAPQAVDSTGAGAQKAANPVDDQKAADPVDDQKAENPQNTADVQAPVDDGDAKNDGKQPQKKLKEPAASEDGRCSYDAFSCLKDPNGEDIVYHDESPRPFRFCVIACKKESYVIPIVTPDEYDIPLSPSEKDKYVVQYDVDCDGDGVYEQTAQSGDVRCELDPGAHHIAIRGVIPGLKFNTGKLSDSEESIELTEPLYTRVISLDQWGDIPWRNLSRMFTCEPADIHLMAHYTPAKGIPGGFGKAWTAVENNRIGTPDRVYNAMDTPNLQYIRKLSCVGGGYTEYRGSFEKWDVSKITDMSAMFKTYGESEVCLSCDPLLGYFDQDISKWNTSNVENTSEMFHGCQSFNQNISGWDTSKVKSMKAMFVDAKAFNQPIGKWNVSNVTNMSDMFVRAVKFNQPLESWNVSNVTDMSGMFDEAFAFNQPLAKWNVSHVEDMDSMFRYADEFNQPLDGWDVTHVKDMNNMFEGASKFQHYPANWVVPKGHVEDMFTDSPVEELAKKNPLKAKKRSK